MNMHELNVLKCDAASATTEELQRSITWNEELAEHFDENMNFNGYKFCMDKLEILRAELAKRDK